MIFNINIDQEPFTLEVSEAVIKEAQEFINEMDADFNRGVQLGRHWLDSPSDEQRCQIAINKIVGAMHQENIRLVYLMASYVLSKFPNIKMITYSSDYEIDEIDIELFE